MTNNSQGALVMDHESCIPAIGFLRLHHIIGDPHANPPIPPIIPVSRASWWAGVAEGRYPPSVKLGPRTTAWRVQDILNLVQEMGDE